MSPILLPIVNLKEITMKINVPFIYEALIVKPRCRKPSLAIIKDTVEVEIKEVTEDMLPVALKVGESSIRWDGNNLWNYYYDVSGKNPALVTADLVKQNTESGNSRYSHYSATSPFSNFWLHGNIQDTMSARHNVRLHGFQHYIDDSSVIELNDLKFREWIDDNKQAVIDKANEIAKGLLILNNVLLTQVGEPRYVIVTFGLGNNHGGTGMFIQSHYNSNIANSNYFNALEFDAAIQYADKVATNRGDNDSVPVRPNCGNRIEVLIPEAVKCSPNTEHGAGCDFINKIESSIVKEGPLGGLLTGLSEIATR